MNLEGRVVAISVGQPQTVPYDGKTVRTAIFKRPVDEPVRLTRLGFVGDGQADRQVHGGPTRAAYLYPHEHYAYWEPRLGGGPLPYGQFGENLTTEGLLETTIRVGDLFVLGGARVQVASPRGPCFKLGIRTGDPTIVAPFLESGRLGAYLSVLEEGMVAPGDAITLLHRLPGALPFADLIAALYLPGAPDELLVRALASPALTESHAQRIEHLLRSRA